ncbi:unnamed protein product [Cyprideis torosa]|uniref:Uncharacterized protein n=1 Tax=Cyprideis torosa TaxID=163714 RepID=A0A7R8W913_9CRUS|nr:unnamed protein product [Cyprideis torosa]CAG0889270.1 unnamed protein product [Cyprideis torosa]
MEPSEISAKRVARAEEAETPNSAEEGTTRAPEEKETQENKLTTQEEQHPKRMEKRHWHGWHHSHVKGEGRKATLRKRHHSHHRIPRELNVRELHSHQARESHSHHPGESQSHQVIKKRDNAKRELEIEEPNWNVKDKSTDSFQGDVLSKREESRRQLRSFDMGGRSGMNMDPGVSVPPGSTEFFSATKKPVAGYEPMFNPYSGLPPPGFAPRQANVRDEPAPLPPGPYASENQFVENHQTMVLIIAPIAALAFVCLILLAAFAMQQFKLAGEPKTGDGGGDDAKGKKGKKKG